jgi:hypothetical protein
MDQLIAHGPSHAKQQPGIHAAGTGRSSRQRIATLRQTISTCLGGAWIGCVYATG